MKVVVDASATIALLYGELSASDQSLLTSAMGRREAVVPQLWHLEVVNVLLIHSRKGRHTLADLREYLEDLGRAEVATDRQTGARAWTATLDLAARHDLTSYDAAYLELAIRERASLATFDKKLIGAAHAANVPLFWS